MASKYLVSGTPSFTASTRGISLAGATMSAAFEAADQTYQRQVFFRSGASLYRGRVERFIDASNIVLLASGALPSGDVSINELFLYDLSEAHTYQAYVDKVQSLIKDTAAKLTAVDIDLLIAQAATTYSRDKSYPVAKKVQGTGASDYNLSSIFGSLWTPEFCAIRSVEFPSGSVPATIMRKDNYELYDDGTAQDGTSVFLRFRSDKPSTTQYFVVQMSVERRVPPAGTQNFPDTNFHFTAITLLAASFGCAVLATAYAQSVEPVVQLDSVQYSEKTNRYMSLAKMYRDAYRSLVFGESGEGGKDVTAATADVAIPIRTTPGGRFLFHDTDTENDGL